jgi:hypothetical protein
VVEASTHADYLSRVRERLLALGLSESSAPGDPICAWRLDGIRVDIMPSDSHILGFSNRLYRSALRSGTQLELDRARVRVIDAPHFVATKFEAFKGRGKSDPYASHDLEDIVTVVDGRPELIEEVASCELELRNYLQAEFRKLVSIADFLNALEGLVEGEGRAPLVLGRIQRLAGADLDPKPATLG